MHIDIATLQKELDQLATYSSSPPPGVTRVLWSKADSAARAFLRERCQAAGLTVYEDALGNLFARWPGSEPELPAVATGSHIDAIPDSGRYDGTVGVFGALEAIRSLQRAGSRPRRSVELLLFTAEEPTRFGLGCLGSRALSGAIAPPALQALRDSDGQSLDELRNAAGFSGDLASVRLPANHYHAFVELHIEQGPLLEAENLPIGIVEAIAAPASLRIQLSGPGGHAGAVLMPQRHDPLLAAAQLALLVEEAALSTGSPNSVATTGLFRVEPGAVNAIPSRVTMEIDVRDTQLELRDVMVMDITGVIEVVCKKRGVEWKTELLNADPPATCHPLVTGAIEVACKAEGLLYRTMPSRAYHDSLFMARICPTAMIFIPCRGGISHRPDEYAAPEAIERGVAILARTLAELSNAS
jgi:ureidoglycolate amidohydrolase